MSLFFVDTESVGKIPAMGRMIEFGVVHYPSMESFHGKLFETTGDIGNMQITAQADDPYLVANRFVLWINKQNESGTRPTMVSDNPAWDWQWISDFLWRYAGENPFGFSARRIGDWYAGLKKNWRDASSWKKLRVTPHDHHPVHDAMGVAESFAKLVDQYGIDPS